MSDPELLVSQADGVLSITLNRPGAANAITADMREGIIAALGDAAADHAVRAVLLGANGRHFCSGADVGALGGAKHVGDGMRRIQNGAQRLISAVFDCPKPVVARVQGAAAGRGAHIAFACDMVVACPEANFIEVFVKRGLTVDAGGAWLLPRLVGLQKAKELIYFGDKVPAAEARELGLINRVVPAEELDAAALALATRLAAGPTIALGFAKRQLNRAFESDRASALLIEAMAQEMNGGASDSTEGVKAFIERREPDFKGY